MTVGTPGKPDGVEQYKERAPFIQVSKDLANAAHLDPNDDGRCHAVWMRSEFLHPEPKHWYMLFPDVGLAIELCHGACLSWDGREARHCTSVAQKDRATDVLWSYYFGLNAPLAHAQVRLEDFERAVTQREASGDSWPPFTDNVKVWVKVTQGPNKRIAKGVVDRVDHDTVHIRMRTTKDVRPVPFALRDPNVVLGASFSYE